MKEWKNKSNQKWYYKNKERISLYGKKYREEHRQEIDERIKKWRSENPDKVRQWEQKRDKKVMATPQGRLNGTMKTSIRVCLKGNKKWSKWEDLVGYTVERLKRHIEKQFSEEMTWDNYGTYWEIDHKIPKAAFHYTTAEDIDFKKCWALNNLQPMLRSENRRKKDYMKKPFQPSLNIAL